ncbi:hypothetical protein ACFLZV_06590 [Candidatus Margulisiibacteriota bacterium]
MQNRGSILLIVLLLISVLLLEGAALVKIYMPFQKADLLYFQHLKSYYLAESGFALSKKYFESIPVVADGLSGEQVKNLISTGLKFEAGLEGKIFLLRSSFEVFSVGVVGGKYISVLRQDYLVDDGTVVLSNWGKL